MENVLFYLFIFSSKNSFNMDMVCYNHIGITNLQFQTVNLNALFIHEYLSHCIRLNIFKFFYWWKPRIYYCFFFYFADKSNIEIKKIEWQNLHMFSGTIQSIKIEILWWMIKRQHIQIHFCQTFNEKLLPVVQSNRLIFISLFQFISMNMKQLLPLTIKCIICFN